MQAMHFPQRAWRVKVRCRSDSFHEILQCLGERVAYSAENGVVRFNKACPRVSSSSFPKKAALRSLLLPLSRRRARIRKRRRRAARQEG